MIIFSDPFLEIQLERAWDVSIVFPVFEGPVIRVDPSRGNGKSFIDTSRGERRFSENKFENQE